MTGEVKLKLAIEGGKIVGAELDGVTSRLSGMEKAAGATSNMLGALQSKVLALSGTFATMLSVHKAVMAADSVTILKNQLDLATGSAQRAAQAYEELFAIAQRSRVSFTELGATFASISRAGQELGISQERLLTVTQAIGQAMTISGGSAQGMQAALVQLGQGLASGTLRGEELNSVMEQAPRLAKALADGMNIPIGKLREMGAAGEITAQQVISALEKSAPQLAREVEGATLTVGQAFTVLQNDVVKFVGDADKATGASAALAQGLVALSGGVRSLGGFIREHETTFALLGGALGGAAVAAGIYATTAAIGALAVKVGVLSAVLMANPILLALGGIAAGVGALIAAQKAYASSAQGMATEVSNLTQRIQDAEATLAHTKGGDALTEKMRARVAAMKAQRAELQGILAVKDSEGLDNRAEDARFAQRAQQIKAQAQAEADLAKLRQKASGVPESYIKDMEDVIRLNQAGVLVGKEYNDMLGQMQAKLVKKSGTLSESAKGLNLYNDLTAQASGLNADFAEKWALLSAAYKGGTISLAHLTDAQAKLLAQQSFAHDLTKALEEEKKKENQATAESAQAYVKYLESLDQATAALAKEVQGQTDHIARMGLSKQAIAELDAARLEEQATMLDGIAIKRMDRNLDEAEYNALKEQARLKRELARLAREGAAKEAAQDMEKASQKAAQDAEEAWRRSCERIESSITDALMRGFENGKGFAENLRDVVVNMFKSMVLRPIVEFSVRGGMSLLGLGGMAGPAGAADMMGGMGGLGNLGSSMSYLSGLSGWFTDFGGSVTASIDKIGRSIADLSEISGSYGATVDSVGTSIQGSAASIGQAASYVGYAMAAVSAIEAADKGQWGKAIGTGVGAYFGGPIGAYIGGEVGGWVDNAFGGGHEYTTGTGITGHFSGNQFSGSNYQEWRNDGSSGVMGIGASGSSSGTNYSSMDASFQKSLGAAYGHVLDQTAAFTKTLGGNADAILKYQTNIKLALGTDVEANKKAISDMFKGLANEVASTVVDAKYIREGEGAADTLARLATNLTVVNGSLDMLGANLLSVGQASGDAASSLVDSFGGLQQYQSAIGTYYQRFYTEEERLAKTREQLQKQFADLGLAVPSTIDAYRNLVNAQDLSTESGRKNYAALISMSSAFADITAAAAAAQVKLSDVAKTLDSMVKDIASARTSVASARNQVSPAPVMGLDAIRAGVLAATSSADTSSMVAAGNVLGQKTLADTIANDAYKVASANATAASQSYASLQDANTAYVNQIKAAGTEIHDIANSYGTHGLGIKLSTIWAPYSTGLNNDAYRYNSATNRVNAFVGYGGDKWTDTQSLWQGGKSTTYYANTAGMLADPRFQQLNAMLGDANSQLQAFENRIEFSKFVLDAANKNLAISTSNKAAADLEAQKAAQDYAKAVNDWTVEASKSVPALEKLRDETMRYYESQKALAELMSTSAANLRAAVRSARTGQLDSAERLAQQQSTFATAYSLALSTSGAVQAGYADKMTAALPELSAALMDTASSRADWAQATAKLFAQSETVAKLLDANAPVNYQADSLAMLDSIDATLAVLDDSTRSITRAIESSGGLTAAGLREVVKALGGTPGFATGGYHSGGARWVGEDGPELEVTGPSHIFNMSQLRRLGSRQQAVDMDAVVDELRALRQDNSNMRAELRAIAISSNKTAKVLERVTPNGSSLQMVVAA